MTEEYLAKITNHLNQKQISYYEIYGKVDNNGELIENFNERQEFHSNYEYKVSQQIVSEELKHRSFSRAWHRSRRQTPRI